ncbi:MAG: hypothetical protein NZ853_09195 [Leptospiraceae bacterium]|nr:hypothetical protein [Leptospiraceae bacterium]MDW7975604.1 hypothetical protein [Leptospiraceae bacterium]
MHRIKEIWQDDINEDVWKHIEACSICRKEYELSKLIKSSISNLPMIEIAPKKEVISQLIHLQTPYDLRFLIILLFIFLFANWIFEKLMMQSTLYTNIIIILILYSSIMSVVISMILGYHIFVKYSKAVIENSKKFDEILKKILMKKEKMTIFR